MVVHSIAEDASMVSEGEAVAPRQRLAVEGFDGFFALHHERIVRSLSLALGDDQLGRDAAAEGFARALQRWRRVSGFDNPAGWVYRVGLNWARSRRRKTVREVAETAAADHGALRSHGSSDPAERDPRVTEALRRLSLDHRAVVVAGYYLDYSEQQIASALDIRPGTVKSRLSRALRQLADDLDTA